MRLHYSHLSGVRAICTLAAITTLAPLAVRADVLFTFGTNNFSGDPSLSTSFPLINALFQDVSPGHVRLTLSAPGLTNNENIDKLYFNLKPADSPTSLIFSNLTVGSGSFTLPTVDEGVDSFKADGDGYYDIRLNFGGSGLTTWFSRGDIMVCDLVGITNLTAADFVYLSKPSGPGSAGPWDAAVHIVSIFQPNGHGDTSGWVASSGPDVVFLVPEPTANSLWVLAVSMWGAFRWSRRRAKVARL